MPNGHGGIPRFGSPVLLGLVLAVLAWIESRGHAPWTAPVAYVVSAVLGWRLAWHLAMYPVTEYGGAYASKAARTAARRRYRRLTAVAMVVAVGIVFVVWRRLG